MGFREDTLVALHVSVVLQQAGLPSAVPGVAGIEHGRVVTMQWPESRSLAILGPEVGVGLPLLAAIYGFARQASGRCPRPSTSSPTGPAC